MNHPEMRILCCGNRDRGDDGAGILVADLLTELGIPAEKCTGEATTLMEKWEDAPEVVVVDAILTGAPIGTIHRWDASEMTLPFVGTESTHGLGVATAIQLSRALGRLPKRLRVYGIEAGQFDSGAAVSSEVRESLKILVREIAEELHTLES